MKIKDDFLVIVSKDDNSASEMEFNFDTEAQAAEFIHTVLNCGNNVKVAVKYFPLVTRRMKKRMTNEEAIEYNENLKAYMKITDKDSDYKFLEENYEALDMGNSALASCEQRVGTWIINKEYDGYETVINDCKCPFCDETALFKKSYSMDGQSIVLYPSNYCPNCGAKLEIDR